MNPSTIVLPAAIRRSIPAAQRARCERVWQRSISRERRAVLAAFCDPVMMGAYLQRFAALVVQAEREGHEANAGRIAQERDVQRALSNIARNRVAWGVKFAQHGNPQQWESWVKFEPSLQEAVGLLWQEWCMMPGAFTAPSSSNQPNSSAA